MYYGSFAWIFEERNEIFREDTPLPSLKLIHSNWVTLDYNKFFDPHFRSQFELNNVLLCLHLPLWLVSWNSIHLVVSSRIEEKELLHPDKLERPRSGLVQTTWGELTIHHKPIEEQVLMLNGQEVHFYALIFFLSLSLQGSGQNHTCLKNIVYGSLFWYKIIIFSLVMFTFSKTRLYCMWKLHSGPCKNLNREPSTVHIPLISTQ